MTKSSAGAVVDSTRRILNATTLSLFALLIADGGAASAAAQPAAPRARLVEDLRLDAVTEDFPQVSRIYVGPQRQIVVPISQDMQLRIFDSSGRRVAVVGRRGAGPGEFTHVQLLGWKADTMWVNDERQRRVTYFATDATLLRATVYPPFGAGPVPGSGRSRGTASNVLTFSPVAIYPDGSMLGISDLSPDSSTAQRAWGGGSAMVRVSTDGARRVLLDLPWMGDDRWSMSVGGFGRLLPFAAWPRYAVSSGGDRIAHLTSVVTSRAGGTFTVSLFRANGDTIFVRSYPFRGFQIPNAVRDSALAAMLPRPGAGSEGPSELPERFQEIARQRMPSVYAGAESLLLGLDNTVWVELHGSAQGQPVLVLNAEGTPIASILVPAGSRLRQASASHVWMTETNEDGLTSVVRYRVSGIVCGIAGC